MSDSLTDLRRAIDDLDRLDRQALAGACGAHRDMYVAHGNHRLAALWQALSVLMSESLADERAVVRAIEDDLSPVVRALTADELAEVRFDDEVDESA